MSTIREVDLEGDPFAGEAALPPEEKTNRARPREKRPQGAVRAAGSGEKKSRQETAIFVTGLPEDTTSAELVDYFAKYGVIMDDMFTGGPRVKMYEEETTGVFKGEALIVYLRGESAKMAIDFLDDSYFRPEVKIRVEAAKFDYPEGDRSKVSKATQDTDGGGGEGREEKGDGAKATGAGAGAKRVDKKTWKQYMQQMSKKLEWTENDYMSPEEERKIQAELRRREKYQRIVVLKNMFTREEIEADARFILDLKEDLMDECEKVGEVTAIHVVQEALTCTVKFREKSAAAACRKMMNGRFFSGRRVVATLYDGSFSLKESKDEEGAEERLEVFAKWLEDSEQHPAGSATRVKHEHEHEHEHEEKIPPPE